MGGDGGSSVPGVKNVVAFARNGSGSVGGGDWPEGRPAAGVEYKTTAAGLRSLMSDSGLLFPRDNVWNIDSLTARLRPGEGSIVGVLSKSPDPLGMAWKTVWPKLKD